MYPYQNASLPVKERLSDLLSRMNVREKIGQLTQSLYGFHCYTRHGDNVTLSPDLYREVEKYGGIGAIYGVFRADPWAQKDFSTGLEGNLAIRTRNRIQECVITHSRLGIPVLFSTECPHGHQTLDGYLLPVNLASAASFSPALVKDAFRVCGEQMHATGVDLAFVSVLDVLRDPRWGRCEECFGEDPYLSSQMARAVIEALRESGVDTVAKHFCAQGEPTGGVNSAAARIGMRELREIHLPPVKAAIEAGAASIMSTYHEIDGVYCTANRALNTDVLRNEYHFGGFVMSDALAVDLLDAITGDRIRSIALAFNAGVDMGLLDHSFEHLEDAICRGYVSTDRLDEAVRRVLRLKFERGLFDDPYLPESAAWTGYTYDTHPQAEALTEQSMILLKNTDHLLPLSKDIAQHIAVVGPNADHIYRQCGDYTPPLRDRGYVTVWQGIRDYVAKHAPNTSVRLLPSPDLFASDPTSIEATVREIKDATTVIAVLGGSSDRYAGSRITAGGQVEEQTTVTMDCGEGIDSASLALPGVQSDLLRALKAKGLRVITVLVGGRPYAMKEIEEYSDAILCCFYPGPLGGKALPRLLFGEIAPAGRLPVSIPDTVGTLPVFYNYKQSYRAMKYYDTPSPTKYPFGFGLTYTAFSYRLCHAPDEKDRTVRFTVKNEGTCASYAVPQLYLRRTSGEVTSRIRELCGFEKVCLAPGEAKTVSIPIPEDSLRQWDLSMHHTLVPGAFEWFLCDMGKEELHGAFEI